MGVQPPGEGQPIQPLKGQEDALEPLKKDLTNRLDRAISELRLMLNSAHLLENPQSLQTLAETLIALDSPSKEAAHLGG